MNDLGDTPTNGRQHKLTHVLRDVDTAEARRLLQIWHVLGSDAPVPDPSEELEARARAALVSAMDREDRPPRRRSAHRSRRRSRLLWPALVVLAVVAAVLWWTRPVARYAPNGTRLEVALADGSSVHLNSGARLTYRRPFSLFGRRVHLEGEAYFDVAPSGAPFVVRTFNAEVTVLGTSFNVRAWRDAEASTFVAVESGRVQVQSASGTEVNLAAGYAVRVRAGDIDSTTVAVPDALAWRSGDFVYKDRMLGVILDDIDRRFGVVVIAGPDVITTERQTVSLRDPDDAESVIRDLAAATSLRYRVRSNGFEIYSP